MGDGKEHTLHVTAASGMTSFFTPDSKRLSSFSGFVEWGQVLERLPLATRRLDDIEQVAHMDMLKIDVQGSELMVFRGAQRLLQEAVAVQTEVPFVPLYENQPVFGDVDNALRDHGFLPHMFAAIKRWPIAPVVYDGDFRKPMNQVLEADVVYVRDFTDSAQMPDEQLMHLAYISHCLYGSSDLAHCCLLALRDRNVVPTDAPETYLLKAHGGLP